MSEKCAVCEKGQGPEKCEVCGFSDNGFINRSFLNPEKTKEWIETVVKPYRIQWEDDLLAQLEKAKKGEAELSRILGSYQINIREVNERETELLAQLEKAKKREAELIGQKLEAATQEVSKVNALMESLEKANADLLKKQEELNERNEAYKKMEENIIRLKKIQETITEEAFNKLKQEHTELDLYFGENGKITVKLKEYGISRIDDFSTEMDNLKKGIKNELARFDNIIKGVIEELEKQKEDIGRRNKTS